MNLRCLSTILFLILLLNKSALAQRNCITAEPVVNAGVINETETQAPLPEIIIIPVVVHIVFHSDNENITNEQVKSQIAVLNNDFRKKNSDAAFIPAAFRDLAADSRIEFRLATIDPQGSVTNGITRKYTEMTAFQADDKVKFNVSGGTDAWNRDQYLNLWVCNLNGGVMGYASTPGGDATTDGVVIRYSVFGTTANVAAPFNKGRTTVHEIGHWLGLRHIWGDAACGDDRIEDTPPQQGPTRGCPSGVLSTCTSGSAGNMYMNFMDFTNDECTNMFTHGQAMKMREPFGQGGARAEILTSNKALGATQVEFIATIPGDQKGMSLSPNPAMSQLRISMPSGTSPVVAKVYNQSGQMVKSVLLNNSVTQISLGDLKAGMYYVIAGVGKALKFVKQ